MTVGPNYSLLIVASIAGILFLPGIWILRCGRRQKNMPPGPPTIPILGNALDFPRSFLCIKFTEWARVYGEIYSLKIFDRDIIVLSSAEAVKGILDKQGMHSGNRMRSRILERGLGGTFFIFEDMTTDKWRKSRKAIHPLVAPNSIDRHLHVQQTESLQLLRDILECPQDIFYHIRRTTASILTTLLYGQRSLGYRGTRIEKFYQMVELMNHTSDPNAHPPIDLFPILQYVPARWAKWKGLCDQLRLLRQELYGSFFSDVERRLESGVPGDSYIAELVQNKESLGMSSEEINAVGGALMDAGSETTSAYLHNFVQALVNYPECQRRAQEEIDRVVGSEGMPTFADFEKMPYVNALILELHRFRPVVPTGIPHVATSDLKYNGYHVPEDSIIFINVWGIHRDPDLFNDPDEFRPERYLGSPFGTKPGADTSDFRDNLAFGAGRRTCPGEHMASRTIAVNVMNLLWAFSFSKDGSEGVDMSMDQYAKPGLELAPLPFTVSVTVRHPHRAEIIKASYEKLAPC